MSLQIPYNPNGPSSRRPIPYTPGGLETARAPIRYQPAALAPAPPAHHRLTLIGPLAPLDPILSTHLLIALHGLDIPLLLELSASGTSVELAVICRGSHAELVERALYGACPGLDIRRSDQPLFPGSFRRLVGTISQGGRAAIAPLRPIESFSHTDPFNDLLGAAQPLRDDERLEIYYFIQPLGPERWKRIHHDELTVAAPPFNLWELVAYCLGRGSRMPKYAPQLQRLLEERLDNQPCFELLGLVYLAGSNDDRLRSRAWTLSAAFSTTFNSGYGGLSVESWNWWSGPHRLRWSPDQSWLVLSAAEMAGLFHVPSGLLAIPGIAYLKRPPQVLPAILTASKGVLVGHHRQRGEDRPVHVPVESFKAGPTLILGRTGQGKTTFGHQLLASAAKLDPTAAICILDFHGSWANSFALHSIPPSRVHHTYLVRLGDTDYPPGIAIFRPPSNVSMDSFKETTFKSFTMVFKESWSFRMERVLYATVSALCEYQQATLFDVPRLYDDPVFQNEVLRHVDDPAAHQFFHYFNGLSPAARSEITAPVLHRLSAFYRSAPIRNIICRTDGVDPIDILNDGGILLFSAAGAEIESEADALFEFLVARITLGLRARLGQEAERQRSLWLAADESQRFRQPSLAVLAAELRKAGLALIALSQYLAGWTDSLEESLLGNASTIVSFAVGVDDARRLAPIFRPYSAEDLLDLEPHEALIKTRLGTASVPAFDVRPPLPIGAPRPDVLDQILQQTRARFGQPRAEVERHFSRAPISAPFHSEIFDVDPE